MPIPVWVHCVLPRAPLFGWLLTKRSCDSAGKPPPLGIQRTSAIRSLRNARRTRGRGNMLSRYGLSPPFLPSWQVCGISASEPRPCMLSPRCFPLGLTAVSDSRYTALCKLEPDPTNRPRREQTCREVQRSVRVVTRCHVPLFEGVALRAAVGSERRVKRRVG